MTVEVVETGERSRRIFGNVLEGSEASRLTVEVVQTGERSRPQKVHLMEGIFLVPGECATLT